MILMCFAHVNRIFNKSLSYAITQMSDMLSSARLLRLLTLRNLSISATFISEEPWEARCPTMMRRTGRDTTRSSTTSVASPIFFETDIRRQPPAIRSPTPTKRKPATTIRRHRQTASRPSVKGSIRIRSTVVWTLAGRRSAIPSARSVA